MGSTGRLRLFDRNHPNTAFILPNFREAVLSLEEEGQVECEPVAPERRKYKGRPSLPEGEWE